MFSSFSLASIFISFDSKLLLNAIERLAGLLEGSGAGGRVTISFFLLPLSRILSPATGEGDESKVMLD